MLDAEKKKMEEITSYWLNAQPVVAAYISSMVPGFQDTDDILQQVAVSIIKNYHVYNKKDSFIAWAVGIAKNEVLMHWRRNNKKVVMDIQTIDIISAVYTEESGKLDEMKQALTVCLRKLKGRWKQVIEMRYLNELKIDRIAQKLGMSESAIYTGLHRVRLGLKDCISQQMAVEE